MIKILYFANLVKYLGRESEDFQLPRTVKTVADLLAWLRQRGDLWEELLADKLVQITVNMQFVTTAESISEGDEVAIIPNR